MNWLLSGWRGWLAAGLVCGTTIAAALTLPVRQPVRPATMPLAPLPGLSAEVATVAAREELGAFLESVRWGDSRPKPRRPAAPAIPTTNPELVKMNYVGLITVHDQRTVLFAVPDVGVVRYAPGDRLPDGRVLVSVTDNSLTLRAEGRPDEELMLFPTTQNVENNRVREPRKPRMPRMRRRGAGASR